MIEEKQIFGTEKCLLKRDTRTLRILDSDIFITGSESAGKIVTPN